MNYKGKAHKVGEHIDTDAIIPARFLVTSDAKKLGENCMSGLEPDWVKRVAPGDILVAGRNFGCGSSREHAPWALDEYGFRAVIAPSFADIFFNNCFKNGLLPIVLPEATIDLLFNEVNAFPGYELTIDLERQVIVRPQGEEIPFDVIPFRKYCLLNGFDDIGLTLRHADKIKAFEAERLAQKPWLAHTLVQG